MSPRSEYSQRSPKRPRSARRRRVDPVGRGRTAGDADEEDLVAEIHPASAAQAVERPGVAVGAAEAPPRDLVGRAEFEHAEDGGRVQRRRPGADVVIAEHGVHAVEEQAEAPAPQFPARAEAEHRVGLADRVDEAVADVGPQRACADLAVHRRKPAISGRSRIQPPSGDPGCAPAPAGANSRTIAAKKATACLRIVSGPQRKRRRRRSAAPIAGRLALEPVPGLGDQIYRLGPISRVG